MNVMHISIYVNIIGAAPGLELYASLCHWVKKWEGLMWGITITVMFYKSEFLHTPVLSLDLLNAKYHDVSSGKHLFLLTYTIHFHIFSALINTDLQSMHLFPLSLISQYIIAAWHGACWKNMEFVLSCDWRIVTLHCNKKVTQNARLWRSKRGTLKKMNSSR